MKDLKITVEKAIIYMNKPIEFDEAKNTKEKTDQACNRVIEIFENLVQGNAVDWQDGDLDSMNIVIGIMNLHYNKNK